MPTNPIPIHLHPRHGEVCPACEGRGEYQDVSDYASVPGEYLTCTPCSGTGKIGGKQHRHPPDCDSAARARGRRGQPRPTPRSAPSAGAGTGMRYSMSPSKISDEELDAIGRNHECVERPFDRWVCNVDEQSWPCDAAQLLAEVRRLKGEVERMRPSAERWEQIERTAVEIEASRSKGDSESRGRVWIEAEEYENLRQRLAAAERDRERYQWLKKHLLAADFDYGEPSVTALVFEMPRRARISADVDETIDAARSHPTPSPADEDEEYPSDG